MTEIALIRPGAFTVAWPAEHARAEALTEIWLRSFKSIHTREAYRRDLDAWLGWLTGARTVPGAARIAHMDLWIERQRQHGAAEASIARRVSAVSSWYGYLIDNTAQDPVPLATSNPAKTRAKPRIDPDFTPTVGLTRNEADRILEAADAESPAAAAITRMLLTGGLRIGTAINARIEHLGWDRGHRTLTLEWKGGTPRRVPIPPFAGEALDVLLAKRGNPKGGPLFITTTGQPAYELWVWRLVRRLGRAAQVPQAAQLSPHSLRHTAITELLDSGASLRDAQDFAGHKDPRTTRRYDHGRHSLDRHGSYILAARYGGKRT